MTGGASSRGLLLAVPAAVVLFLLLAMADQHETFLSALRPPVITLPSAVDPVLRTRAEETIRLLTKATERCWAEGSIDPLRTAGASPEMTDALARELDLAVTRERSRGARCGELKLLDARPAPDGQWEAFTEELWTFESGRSLLRFRYRLALEAGHFRPLSMTPILPEPEIETTR